MAGSLNRVEIIGYVGRDPEVRYTASGAAIANLSVATTEHWRDKATGEQKEATEWHRCSAFDKQAEFIGERVKKGSYVRAAGKLQTRKWQDKDGTDRYTTEIVVREFMLLDRTQHGDEEGGAPPPKRQSAPQGSPNNSRPAPRRQEPARSTSGDPGGFDSMDDDIPF